TGRSGSTPTSSTAWCWTSSRTDPSQRKRHSCIVVTCSPRRHREPGAGGVAEGKSEDGLLRLAGGRGDAPGIQDLLGGRIACSVNNIGVILPHLKGGRARVLATSGTKRSRFTPKVRTFVEAGYKDVEAQEWFGFVMPSKVSPA